MRKFVVKKLLQHCNKNTSLYSIGFFFFLRTMMYQGSAVSLQHEEILKSEIDGRVRLSFERIFPS